MGVSIAGEGGGLHDRPCDRRPRARRRRAARLGHNAVMRVLIAGATGAVGRVLARLLVADGHQVFGTTRRPERAAMLASLGVEPLVVDVFDPPALSAAARHAAPDAVVHQLTDLPNTLAPAAMPAALERNARIREVGTAHLLEALAQTPARRLVVQSIAFIYGPTPPPHREDDALNVEAEDPAAKQSATAVQTMEQLCLAAAVEALVLRYGYFYGPHTWFSAPPGGCAVHVEAAAHAARLALTNGAAGIYNVAEPGGSVVVDKAQRDLHWDHGFRQS